MFDAAMRERGTRMYTLHIANKNYSSWSLRPWVLMRGAAIPFEEKLTPFPTGSQLGCRPLALAERPRPLPDRRRLGSGTFAGDR